MKEHPATVRFRIPRGWRIATSLDALPGKTATFTAPNYDVLTDCPIELGKFLLKSFRYRGKEHRWGIHGPGNYNVARTIRETKKIVDAAVKMFGDLPYRHYTFFLHTNPAGGGGLEHLNSCDLMMAPDSFHPREKEERFLDLVAHEFFHLWNVKRIRPEALGPFDYQRENYTRLLWVMEGITNYFSPLILRRAGIVSTRGYLKRLAERIQAWREKPGRFVQSLEESSFDTWIKFYQPGENSANAEISYYEKGELVGLLLDLELRRRTANRKSLDDVMRLLYRRYAARGVGFPEDGFQAAAEKICGGSLASFFRTCVSGTSELNFERALLAIGLRLFKKPKKEKDGKLLPRRIAHLGIKVEKQGDNRLLISRVVRGTAAWRDGVNPGDELLAIDGMKAGAESWEKRIEEKSPGDRVEVALFRRGVLQTVPVTLGARENIDYAIEPVAKPTPLQRKIAESWLDDQWKALTS
ncbi:MAG: hypothetical protein A2Z34_05270 [Planctomycetes bacterium RBG_16_59_8]|nr:MAG: hypothetical protein A2Z34_05270 [Planctomycetes bacterium RBG_16_59_8]